MRWLPPVVLSNPQSDFHFANPCVVALCFPQLFLCKTGFLKPVSEKNLFCGSVFDLMWHRIAPSHAERSCADHRTVEMPMAQPRTHTPAGRLHLLSPAALPRPGPVKNPLLSFLCRGAVFVEIKTGPLKNKKQKKPGGGLGGKL